VKIPDLAGVMEQEELVLSREVKDRQDIPWKPPSHRTTVLSASQVEVGPDRVSTYHPAVSLRASCRPSGCRAG
jgi:hypothetical protein